MTVEITVEVTSYTTRPPDPDDCWDQGDEEGHVTDVRATYTTLQADPSRYRASLWDSDARPGDVVYVVVADYLSGSTFGTTAGHYSVLGVFRDGAEAAALAAAASAVQGFTFTHGGQEYYADWTGYFERLQSIRAWPVVVT